MPLDHCILKFKKFLFVGLLVLPTACSTISKFDQYAYTQTTSLKVDAINMMGHAGEQYSIHIADVYGIQTAIDKMFEYEKNRPKNIISEKMWMILKDSTGHMVGGFIKRWQKEGTLDMVFIKESQGMVGTAFDQISQLESGKIKPEQIINQ